MRSKIFYTERYIAIQDNVKQFLNAQQDFLSPSTVGSPRAVGDAIQEILGRNFESILGDACAECSADFARVGRWPMWHLPMKPACITLWT